MVSTTSSVVKARKGSTPTGPLLPAQLQLRKLQRRRAALGAGFVAPAVLLSLIVFFLPLLYSVWMALHDWPLLGSTHKFIGVDNFKTISQDALFRKSIFFTIVYTVVSSAVLLTFGFALALLVAAPRRGVGFFRTVYFLPFVVGGAAAALEWVVLFRSDVGPFSIILKAVGLGDGATDFLGTSAHAFMSVLVMVLWKSVGFQMLVMLVGLQAIDPSLYEAARLDGASAGQLLRHITLPLMRPTLSLLIVLTVTGGLLAFDQFYILTSGGPDNSTLTMVYAVYRAAFTNYKLGLANAVALVVLLVTIIVNLGQLSIIRKGGAQ